MTVKQCEAYQVSDQKRCEKCDLLWDMNDPDPPKCLTGRELFKIKLEQIKNERLLQEKS